MKIIPIILTAFISFISAHTLNVSGKIVNKNSNAIQGVNVFSGTNGTISINDGSFSLEVNPFDILIFKHIGYLTAEYIANELPETIILEKNILRSDQIIVSSGLKNISLSQSYSSLNIISSNEIRHGRENHFKDIISQIPNLTYASGTSNPRYFLIRGIGEISQFATEGNPNFSVGYLLDHIDYSGIGSIGATFGIKQIEVFKGPQNYIFGPNAMAGVINIKSLTPTPFLSGQTILGINTDGGYNAGISISNSISNKIQYRITGFKNYSNGFTYNSYHQINNTNKKDEYFIRLNLKWEINEYFNQNLIYLKSYQNNGYDSWTPDNNRDTTYTDYPGSDKLNTNSVSIESKYKYNNRFRCISILTASNNIIDYNFDGDWANNSYWYNFDSTTVNLWGGWSFTDLTNRKRSTFTHDLRFDFSTSLFSLILGVFNKSMLEDDNRQGWLFGGTADNTNTSFDINLISLYNNLTFDLNNSVQIDIGSRLTQYFNSYFGDGKILNWNTMQNESIPEVEQALTNNVLGFQFTIGKKINNNIKISSSLNRGYKLGGINQNPVLPNSEKIYKPEINFNISTTLKVIKNRFESNITAFYMQRYDQQVNLYYQVNNNDPTSFSFYTANANKGYNAGLETSIKFKLTKQLSFIFNNGLLQNHVNSFLDPIDSTMYGNREPAHSPSYNYSIKMNYNIQSGLYLNFENSGMDSFYIDDQAPIKSTKYNIVNLDFSYKINQFNISIWGKNIFDKKYITRGYFFDLGIGDQGEQFYKMFGDPAHFGISTTYSF